MSATLTLITAPAVEPVSLSQLKGILRIPAGDTSWDSTLGIFLVAARERVETYCRIKLIMQTWLLKADSFPGVSPRYDRGGFPALALPFPPFQSVSLFQYVDVAGVVDTFTRNIDYNVNPADSFYGYQLQPGGRYSGIAPATLTPPWARPWPPQRLVPANTLVKFRCGYGGPLTVSIAASSAVLASPGFVFNPDDAPQLAGEVGAPISIPGAGPVVGNAATALVTTIASVDGNGVATLAAQASTAVNGATAWLGMQVPMSLQLAILFQAQFFFEQGAVSDQVEPRVIDSLKNSGYRNLVS